MSTSRERANLSEASVNCSSPEKSKKKQKRQKAEENETGANSQSEEDETAAPSNICPRLIVPADTKVNRILREFSEEQFRIDEPEPQSGDDTDDDDYHSRTSKPTIPRIKYSVLIKAKQNALERLLTTSNIFESLKEIVPAASLPAEDEEQEGLSEEEKEKFNLINIMQRPHLDRFLFPFTYDIIEWIYKNSNFVLPRELII